MSRPKLSAAQALKTADNMRSVVRGLQNPSPIYLALLALADEVQRLRAKLSKAQVGR